MVRGRTVERPLSILWAAGRGSAAAYHIRISHRLTCRMFGGEKGGGGEGIEAPYDEHAVDYACMPLRRSNFVRAQVFPDEFHLASLEPFLEGVCRLKEKVRVRPVLESLMERIGNYVEEHPDALPRDVRYSLFLPLTCLSGQYSSYPVHLAGLYLARSRFVFDFVLMKVNEEPCC